MLKGERYEGRERVSIIKEDDIHVWKCYNETPYTII
jgi:hypothetical protein